MPTGIRTAVALAHLLLPHNPDSAAAQSVAPPAPVARTGQTTCYDQNGGTTACTGSGQDGETLAGRPWPEPRFTDNRDQTLTDRLTGLVWPRDADPTLGKANWQQALALARDLNRRRYLGHDDWRLPNILELESLVNKENSPASWLPAQGFRNLCRGDYWTSTTYASYPAFAWTVGTDAGIVGGHRKTGTCCVWPVRTGQSGVIALPRTGQTHCHDSGGALADCSRASQDGELRSGRAWPRPRFIVQQQQTAQDRLTGLVWSRDGNAPGPAACNAGSPMSWQGALSYVRCLNTRQFQGKSDWRLPNRNELASLVNHGEADSAAWLNKSGFTGVQAGSYWSSSTYAATTWNAWSVNMHDGAVTSTAKQHDLNVWPVRSGDEFAPGSHARPHLLNQQ